MPGLCKKNSITRFGKSTSKQLSSTVLVFAIAWVHILTSLKDELGSRPVIQKSLFLSKLLLASVLLQKQKIKIKLNIISYFVLCSVCFTWCYSSNCRWIYLKLSVFSFVICEFNNSSKKPLTIIHVLFKPSPLNFQDQVKLRFLG